MTTALLTVGGLGRLPGGATLVSALAACVWLAFGRAGASRLALLVLFILVGGASVVAVAGVTGDPREVVIDEYLGMSAALLFVPFTEHVVALVLFVCFRALDLLKVPPFSWIERWASPQAILADDVAIGAFLGVAYTAVMAAGFHA